MVGEVASAHPLAVLSPLEIEGETGQEMSVLVTDVHGRTQSRVRWLYQLGPPDKVVMYNCRAPKKSVAPDSCQVVVVLRSDHTSKETWDASVELPKAAARKWLKARADTEMMDAGAASFSNGQLRVVCRVPCGRRLSCLRASGLDGVFVNPFWTAESDREEFGVAPLPKDMALESACRQSVFFEQSAGVVVTRAGFGLRVPPAARDDVIRQIHKEDASRFLGEKFEASGLPLSMGPAGVKELLSPWEARPLATFRRGLRRTWIVRACSEPVTTVLQHDFGVAVVNKAEERPPQQQPQRPRMKWAPAKGAPRPDPSWPKSWADVARGAPAPAAGAARPAEAPAAPAETPPRRRAAAPETPVATPAATPVAAPALPAMGDFQAAIAAAVAAAVAPLQQQIVGAAAAVAPMQQQLAALQDELRAIREEEVEPFEDGLEMEEEEEDEEAAAGKEARPAADAAEGQRKARRLAIR